MAHSTLPFLVIQDFKENPRKCTAEPLRGLDGFEFVRLGRPKPREKPIEVPGGICLDVDAPVLSDRDRGLLDGEVARGEALGGGARILILDATWARLSVLRSRIVVREGTCVVRRSLPPELVTAYPRRSKLYRDPSAGLATVEAIFAAACLLGDVRPEILAAYRWGDDFVDRNRAHLTGIPSGWGRPVESPRVSGGVGTAPARTASDV